MTVAVNIKFKRGVKRNLPTSAPVGEPYFTIDSKELFIGTGPGTPLANVTNQPSTLVFCWQSPKNNQKSNKLLVPFIKDISEVHVLVDEGENTFIPFTIEVYINGINLHTVNVTSGTLAYTLNNTIKLNKNDVVYAVVKGNVDYKFKTVTLQLYAT